MLQIKYLRQVDEKNEKNEKKINTLENKILYLKSRKPLKEKKSIYFRYNYYKNFKRRIFSDYIKKYPFI